MRFIHSAVAAAGCRYGSNGHAEFHPRQHDQHHHYDADNQRNSADQDLRRKLCQLFRHERHTVWRDWSKRDHLQRDQCRRTVPARDRHQGGGHRRTAGHYAHYRNRIGHKLAIGVLAIICALPATAEEGGTTAIANPVATSTGSVSNQAVQINQGSYSQQSYGTGHSCNSSTLVFTPFYLGNDVNPEPYVRNQNFGAQVSFSVPLDFEMVRLCKELAKRKLEKERLDYALVRALKCAELLKMGFKIRDDSPYASVCADVVPIAAALPNSAPSSRAVSVSSSPKP